MVYIYEYEKIVYPAIFGDIGLNRFATAGSGPSNCNPFSAARNRVRILV